MNFRKAATRCGACAGPPDPLKNRIFWILHRCDPPLAGQPSNQPLEKTHRCVPFHDVIAQ